MVTTQTVLVLVCNNCKMQYENIEGYIPHYLDMDELNSDKENIIEQSNWVFIGDEAYCQDCKKHIH